MPTNSLILAIGFGTPWMLAWLAAAAVPILIHLWNRRRYRQTPWAAMEFLIAAMRNNSRRIRVEQWILLAVRTLLVALLVIAFSEPYWEQLGITAAPGQSTHKVLVLDGSYSMAYRPTDKSRFERAKEVVTEIVEQSPAGDGFTLVLMADPPRVVVGTPAFEKRDFLEEVANIKLPHAGGDLVATLTHIEELLNKAARENLRLVRQEVYFFTDMGRNTWLPDLGGAEAVAEYRSRLRRLKDAGAAMVLIDLGQAASENLAVTELRRTEAFATLGREVVVEGEVRNFGDQARARHLIELLIDGQRTKEEYLDVEPGGRVAFSFPYQFERTGHHAVEVRLGSDLLEIDNHRWLSLEVKERLNVLCVDGQPGGGLRSGTGYLVKALDPSHGQGNAVVQAKVISESGLLDEDLNQYDCVFLCNASQFTASEAKLLERYLKCGGGLVFFLGDRVQPERYNQELAGITGSARVLPVQLDCVVGEAQYHFNPLEYRNPIVSEFRDQQQAGLLNTPVYRYMRMKPLEGSTAEVALAFENGDPAIAEESIEQGRSIVVAVPASIVLDSTSRTPWTLLPKWHSFVPLVHELLRAAIGRKSFGNNVEVGHELAGQISPGASQAALTVRTPDNRTEQIRATTNGGDSRWTFADTWQSGVYSVDPGTPSPSSEIFAVNIDTAESDLAKVEAAELPSEFTPQTSWQNLDDRPTASLGRRSLLHRWLLYGVLGLLLTETTLAWAFGYRAR